VPNNSRKIPRQARSVVTVDALLEATTHILLKDGMHALTTNRVAEIAGVSIGSLYQYFPNKASLLAALIDLHVHREVETLTKLFSDRREPINKSFVQDVIKGFIQIHLDDLELTKILHQQVSFLECRDALRQATKHFEALVLEVLRENFQNQPDSILHIKAFVVTNAVDSLVQLALTEDTDLLKDPDLLNELVQLVVQVFEPKL